MVCDVCLDDDDDEDNEIVICELCLGAVHQKCYGSELLKSVPTGDWFCARCRDLQSNPDKQGNEIKCSYCPEVKGILKPLSRNGTPTGTWAHAICVNWLEGIWFKDEKIE